MKHKMIFFFFHVLDRQHKGMPIFQSGTQFAYFCTGKKFNPLIFLTFHWFTNRFYYNDSNVKTAVYSFDHGHVVLTALYIVRF